MGKKLEKKGVPAYMVTLGDMWSLMLTFFIMLFAMSEVDATKFRKLQGTLKETFGYNQKEVNWGPPPGVSMITSPTSSSSSGSEVIIEESTSTTIIDPQLAALKIESCERQMKKDVVDKNTAKKNSVLIRKVLEPELSKELFSLVEDGKDVRLIFSDKQAFSSSSQLNVDMKKGLQKLGVALGAAQGAVLVRSYIPVGYKGEFKVAYQESSLRSAAIGTALMSSSRISYDRIQIESMSNSRAPSSIKSMSESATLPFYEVTISKD